MELTLINFLLVALFILLIAGIFGIAIGLLLIWFMDKDDEINKK